MAYKRKTKDTWQIHVNYGLGFEHELTETTRKEAIARRREYVENCPQYDVRVIMKREAITQ